MIKEAIVKIVNKEDLTYYEAYTVMSEIMRVKLHPHRMPLFLQHCHKSARRKLLMNCRMCCGNERTRNKG